MPYALPTTPAQYCWGSMDLGTDYYCYAGVPLALYWSLTHEGCLGVTYLVLGACCPPDTS